MLIKRVEIVIGNEVYFYRETVEVYGRFDKKWVPRKLAFVLPGSTRPYVCFNRNSEVHFTAYARIRKIRPKIEVDVRINGKAAKPSDISLETWNKLRDANIEQTHHEAKSCSLCGREGGDCPPVRDI